MLISIIKSKIHLATLTDTHLDYEGSIGVDPELLQAAGIIPGEKVHVLNYHNGSRLITYAIEGKKGEVSLRGPAARLGKKGEKVVIIAYGLVDPLIEAAIKPKVVHVNDRNELKSRGKGGMNL
ncbi:MAG: aspartate 1-decarboxylase [Candidatus Margulisbacteria bacterium]|nr:aspartate 1-decarboxylase [Candidatus Margulisiibacteriota bacterium]